MCEAPAATPGTEDKTIASTNKLFEMIKAPNDLVIEFFILYSRFEFSLKTIGYLRTDKCANKKALPAWRRFAADIKDKMRETETNKEVKSAIDYLIEKPPKKELKTSDSKSTRWEDVALEGASDLEKAIDACERIRNNLFHGGKYRYDEPDSGRDKKLIECALTFLKACLQNHVCLLKTFNGA